MESLVVSIDVLISHSPIFPATLDSLTAAIIDLVTANIGAVERSSSILHAIRVFYSSINKCFPIFLEESVRGKLSKVVVLVALSKFKQVWAIFGLGKPQIRASLVHDRASKAHEPTQSWSIDAAFHQGAARFGENDILEVHFIYHVFFNDDQVSQVFEGIIAQTVRRANLSVGATCTRRVEVIADWKTFTARRWNGSVLSGNRHSQAKQCFIIVSGGAEATTAPAAILTTFSARALGYAVLSIATVVHGVADITFRATSTLASA